VRVVVWADDALDDHQIPMAFLEAVAEVGRRPAVGSCHREARVCHERWETEARQTAEAAGGK
jgi:hypothetical protein